MKDLNQNLLNSIDLIQEATVESELNVCNALITEYFKQADILAYADESVVNEFAIIQEGFFTEAETKVIEDKGSTKKKELLIVRIFKAIGQAIKKAWDWLTEKFTKAWEWLKEKFAKKGKKKENLKSTPEVIKATDKAAEAPTEAPTETSGGEENAEQPVAEPEQQSVKQLTTTADSESYAIQALESYEVPSIVRLMTAVTALNSLFKEFIQMYEKMDGTPDGTFKQKLANVRKMFGNIETERIVGTRENVQATLVAPIGEGDYQGESRGELWQKCSGTSREIASIISSEFGELKSVSSGDDNLDSYINAYMEDAKVFHAIVGELNKTGATISKVYVEMMTGNKNVKEGN